MKHLFSVIVNDLGKVKLFGEIARENSIIFASLISYKEEMFKSSFFSYLMDLNKRAVDLLKDIENIKKNSVIEANASALVPAAIATGTSVSSNYSAFSAKGNMFNSSSQSIAPMDIELTNIYQLFY